MGFWGFLGGWGGVRFCFSFASEGKGEESPFDFSIKLINLRIMLFLFFLHTLLLIGMADVMLRFRGRFC